MHNKKRSEKKKSMLHRTKKKKLKKQRLGVGNESYTDCKYVCMRKVFFIDLNGLVCLFALSWA